MPQIVMTGCNLLSGDPHEGAERTARIRVTMGATIHTLVLYYEVSIFGSVGK